MQAHKKPRLGVWKFASCDGCQLSLLDCEDEILAIAGAVDIAYFPEATRGEVKGVYDLSLVEGSITTPHDAAAGPLRSRHARAQARRMAAARLRERAARAGSPPRTAPAHRRR